MIGSAYLAAEGYEVQLADELRRAGLDVTAWHGRLALCPAPPRPIAWALDTWTAPEQIAVASVKAAADTLRAMQRNWALYSATAHRRCALIEARLPPVSARPIVFPQASPSSHLGGWTLLDPASMLASSTKTSPFPNGVVAFVEDRVAPPSRAYLKLWEACCRIGAWPLAGQSCVELGASPGGWTWVAATLGATVTAIDRAALDPRVAALPGVNFTEGDAFAMTPRAVDWLLCDVIAYPARLLGLVQRWIAEAAPGRIVCTVKLQGTEHDAVADAFGRIDGGTLMHLYHNKHELTFCWQRAG